jgi:endonuclease III
MQLSLPFGTPQGLPPIRDRLLAAYGPQSDERRHHPNIQFLKAMISSCTLDAVSDAAFARLKTSLFSLEELVDADPDAIVRIIWDVTYAPDKARRLIEAAGIICRHRGRFDLAFLADWSVENALSWLRKLPGINSKVAAVILNFSSLRKRALVVDRHVLRVSKRLGLLPEKADYERGFRTLMRLVPDEWDADDLYELHWLMKMHGQTTCRDQHPACSRCPVAQLCSMPKP